MSFLAVAGGAVLALALNEVCDLSPWAADKVVRWAADVRYSDPERAKVRGEELSALISARPGKLFKLITALCFAAAAVRAWAARAAADLSVHRPSISASGAVTLKKAAVAAVACTAALGALTALPSGPSGLARDGGQVGGAARNATPPGSAPSNVVAAVSALLATGSSSNTQLYDAADNVTNCAYVVSGVSSIRAVRDQRRTEYEQARALSTKGIQNGTALKSARRAALLHARDADSDYLAWANQQLADCQLGRMSRSALTADTQALEYKSSFVRLWNPLASSYGLPKASVAQI